MQGTAVAFFLPEQCTDCIRVAGLLYGAAMSAEGV